MSVERIRIGKIGEEAASCLLRKKGYRILSRNYSSRLGEIDIIALDKGTVCFIEVKARRSARFGLPQESVTRHKQRQMSKAALVYLKEKNLLGKSARFDVVSLFYSGENVQAELFQNAFELDSEFSY